MSNLTLIDGDYLLYIALNPEKELDTEGNPVRKDEKFVYKQVDLFQSISRLNTIIIDILNTCEADYYLGFLTGGSFRYKINPDYKANRKGRERPKYFKVLREYAIEEWKFSIDPEKEADDMVNIYRNFFINKVDYSLWEGERYNPIIVSNDKDILDLEGRHYNPMTKKFIETTKEEAEFYFWSDMIIGQPGDNIKGIPGLGLKAKEKLFTGTSALNLSSVVFNKYMNVMGEREGMEAFYKNYKCLKILDEYEGLTLPEPVKYERKG